MLMFDRVEFLAVLIGIIMKYFKRANSRLILMNWKSAAPPPYRQWVFDFLHARRMEKIRFAIKQKPKLFLKVWSPFLEYLKQTTVS